MSDTLDSKASWFSKDIKSSEYLYGVSACHFANFTYKGAIKEKIKCAKWLRTQLNIMLDGGLLSTEPRENEEYSEYQLIEMRLNAVEKAIEFNEFLLKELEECKG